MAGLTTECWIYLATVAAVVLTAIFSDGPSGAMGAEGALLCISA
jgi:hypothetical protein